MSISRLFQKIYQTAQEIKEPFSIIILDIDFLIRYCMRLTSKQCDFVMIKIKAFFKRQFKNDILITWKNCDEICILCKGQTDSEVTKYLEDIKKIFLRQRFVDHCGGIFQKSRLSFSAGIASYSENTNQKQAVQNAYIALMVAKSRRRNTIVCFPKNVTCNEQRILYNPRLPVTVMMGKLAQPGKLLKDTAPMDAVFWEPQAITVSDEKDIFIADQNNHQIIKYDGRNVKSIIGDGEFDSVKDNSTYRLNKPTGVYVKKGMLYVADTGNDVVIQKNLISGKIKIICGKRRNAGFWGDGKIAEGALLNKPGGIAADKENNLYISDIANNVIRKIDRNGIITTFAGNGSFDFGGDGSSAKKASFNEIYGICTDIKGENLFIADYLNHRIRKIHISTGIISTVAGNGISGYYGDGKEPNTASLDRPVAVCTDVKNNLYIAESGNHAVRIILAEQNKIFTLIGGVGMGWNQTGCCKDFKLSNPSSLAVHENYLYILDGANSQIYKVDISEVLR